MRFRNFKCEIKLRDVGSYQAQQFEIADTLRRLANSLDAKIGEFDVVLPPTTCTNGGYAKIYRKEVK